jgi:histidinol-phosphate aminotransferase
MLSRVTDRTKLVWVCNPNNPTGTIVTKDEFESFMSQVPSSVLVVLDEAYVEYVTDASFPDGIKLLSTYKNLIVLRTFSKIFGLASLRIGYGVGHPDVIRFINQVREPFNTSRVAQAAALAALEDTAFLNECRDRNSEGLAYLREQFERMGLQYFDAHGNFIMFDAKLPSRDVFDALLRKGIISRAGWQFYPTYIRITVGSRDQNEKFIAALEQVLQEAAVLG